MNRYTRRSSLGLGLGMLVAGCGGGGGTPTPSATATPRPSPTPTPTPTATPTATGSIATAAAAKNMKFGSTFAWSQPGADAGSFANPAYATLLERDCNILVPENELKWEAIRPSATDFDFTRADAMLAYGVV